MTVVTKPATPHEHFHQLERLRQALALGDRHDGVSEAPAIPEGDGQHRRVMFVIAEPLNLEACPEVGDDGVIDRLMVDHVLALALRGLVRVAWVLAS